VILNFRRKLAPSPAFDTQEMLFPTDIADLADSTPSTKQRTLLPRQHPDMHR
jgi:hypothetical protein